MHTISTLEAIKDSGVKKEDVFLSTKLWASEYENENAVDDIKDNLDIFDFSFTDDEMNAIAKLDKGVRYYNRTDEQLKEFAAWQSAYER